MRRIDADKLKELFSEVIGSIAKKPEMNGNLEHMIRASAMVIQMIDDAPTVNALNCSEIPNNWIPCSERLPEKEGWYITTVESEKTGKRRIENDLFAVDIALAHGHTPNKFCKDGYRQRTVAWMPFPEPYQGRGEEHETD